MAPSKVDSPFVGLVPYTEEDAEFFFGRTRDQQRILANLFAARLSILYGASGVGKSSVLRAGIIKEVRERIERARAAGEEPEVAAVYFKDWKGDALARLRLAIGSALQSLLGQDLVSDLPPSLSLKELLVAIGERFHGDLLLILDQFEEYFLYRPDPQPDQFAREFAEAANQTGLPASFLVALRDDAVTRLDRFKPLIPNLFANYLRLDHLSGEDARRAIEEPIVRYNQLPEERKETAGTFSIQPELVGVVVDQVRTGRVLIGQVGHGILAAGSPAAETAVETPYLQLVMTRLWKEEVRLGSRTLRVETLRKLGSADTIVKSHLEAALAGLSNEDRGLCARMFPHLVTPSGPKIAHTVPNLTRFAKVPAERLTPLLEGLAGSDKRILAPVAPPDGEPGQLQYEIYHDSLAQAVLAWQQRWEEQQELEARAREKRRVVKIAVALALAFLVAAGAAGFAWRESRAVKALTEERATLVEAQAKALDAQRLLALANHNNVLADQYAAQEKQAREEVASLRQLAQGAQPAKPTLAPAQSVVPDSGSKPDASAARVGDPGQARPKPEETKSVPAVATPNPSVEEPKLPAPPKERSLDEVRDEARGVSNPQLSLALAVYVAQKSSANGKGVDPTIESLLYRNAGPVLTIPIPTSTGNFSQLGAPVKLVFSSDSNAIGAIGEGGHCLVPLVQRVAECSPEGSEYAMDSSPDMNAFAVGGLRFLGSIRPTLQLRRAPSRVHDVWWLAFGPQGVVAYTIHSVHQQQVRFWNSITGELFDPKGQLGKNKKDVSALAFSPDGTILATATIDSIELWSYPAGVLLHTLEVNGLARQIVFSHDGKRVAAAGHFAPSSVNANVVVSDLASGWRVNMLENTTSGEFNALSLSPDGTRLALRVASGPVILELLDQNKTIQLRPGAAAFSPDGKWLAIIDATNVMIYPATPTALVAYAKTKARKLTAEECKVYLGLETCPQ